MTFAELLASMTVVAIVMPVMIGAVLYANRSVVMAQRRSEAVFRADQLLQEAIATGSWQDGDEDGEFEDGMTWERTIDQWDVAPLSKVRVVVTYLVQGTPFEEEIVRVVHSEAVTP
jgi:type II secretory pathway pseudopilin PulG